VRGDKGEGERREGGKLIERRGEQDRRKGGRRKGKGEGDREGVEGG